MGTQLSWAVVGFGFLSLIARADFPRFKVVESSLISKCFKGDHIDAEGYYSASNQWALSCPREILLESLKDEKIHDPAINLLVGRVLHQEILKIRGEVLAEFLNKKKQDASLLESPLFNVFHDLFQATQATLTPPPHAPFESSEGTVVAKTQDFVSAAESRLALLLVGEGKGAPAGVLASEAALEYLNILGDSLRFAAAADFLNQNAALFQSSSLQKEALTSVLKWDDLFGALPLRPWLLSKLEAARGKDASSTPRPEQLSYWLKSLELSGAPEKSDKVKREALVSRLRNLWIAYPAPSDAFKIRTAADRLGVSSEFLGPGTRDMNLDELLARTKAQVGIMDTAGALRTLARVKSLPRSQLTPDDIWAALQLHVRVLRISDQRHLIPGILKVYVKLGKFADPPANASAADMNTFLQRGIDITKFSWSYDSLPKTRELLDRYLKVANTPGRESAYGQLLYLKGRILEQDKNLEVTRVAFSEALGKKLPADLLADLMWRNLALHFDLVRAGENPSILMALFEPLKKVLADDFDKSRWHYWRGQALLLTPVPEKSHDKPETLAIAEFEKSYKAEPYSFYSNLSGLELIRFDKKPKDWVLASGDHYSTPKWSRYFSDTGKLENPVYADLAKVYFLGSIGDFNGATNAARQMDAPLWDRILSSKSVVKDRKSYARAVAWLRLAIQDPMGSLKVAEIARRAFVGDFEDEDFLYLYPLPYWEHIQAEATQRGVNPWLVASLIRQESAFNPRAKSIANALGLMQIIPSVAKEEAQAVGIEDFEVEQLYNPPTALKVGVFHLGRRLKDMDGSWIGATAAYNAGLPPVKNWLANYDTRSPIAFIERISFIETRNYVRSILRNYMNYSRIYGNADFDVKPITKMPATVLPVAR